MKKQSMPVSTIIKELEKSLAIANATTKDFVVHNADIALKGIVDEERDDELHMFMPHHNNALNKNYKENLLSELKLSLFVNHFQHENVKKQNSSNQG